MLKAYKVRLAHPATITVLHVEKNHQDNPSQPKLRPQLSVLERSHKHFGKHLDTPSLQGLSTNQTNAISNLHPAVLFFNSNRVSTLMSTQAL